jgi:hypothetical protein
VDLAVAGVADGEEGFPIREESATAFGVVDFLGFISFADLALWIFREVRVSLDPILPQLLLHAGRHLPK